MNARGYLTINSQPRVNGEKSSHPAVGWGGPGGYVYQKAYLEFFTSPANVEKLVKLALQYPSLSYTAVNVEGKSVTNTEFDSKGSVVNAVTWGMSHCMSVSNTASEKQYPSMLLSMTDRCIPK
jgi:methylenetetrahydrofolate reductase (NADPH)